MEETQGTSDQQNSEPWDTLDRKKHTEKLIEGLTCELPHYYDKIVPAQTWTVYWIAHSLALLEKPQILYTLTEDVIDFIGECAHEEGGYGGGPGQIAHLACTFAAVNALISLSSEDALESIDRVKLVRFLHRMKQSDGSFTMHDDGEIDSRASYCALAVLRCLNIQDFILLENVADWILSCQTYEGGFGSVPGSEAHGGYTFCCVASLCLLNQLKRANLPALIRWLTNKQMSDEGGFCGRSNKLVDSCYSYWQGAVFPLIHPFLKNMNLSSTSNSFSYSTTNTSSSSSSSSRSSDEEEKRKSNESSPELSSRVRPTTRSTTKGQKHATGEDRQDFSIDSLLNNWLFECSALQDYVLNKCQSKEGLLKDKPGTPPDFYHTCYALSGLSISQHQPDDSVFDIGSQPINILGATNPLFNLPISSLDACFDFFRNKRIQTFKESQKHDDH